MHRVGRATVVAAAVVTFGACGGGDDTGGIVFDSVPPTTAAPPTTASTDTTAPSGVSTPGAGATTTTATDTDVVNGGWTFATANLEGLSSECGNLPVVAVRPDRDTVLAGVALQGLWASEDGAPTWRHLGEGAGSDTIDNRPQSFVFDPDHPSTFWMSGIYGSAGVFRTDDDGTTFTQLGDIVSIDRVTVDLTDPARQTLLASGHEKAALYLSTDGGSSWTDIAGSLPPDVGFTTAPLIIDRNTFLLGTNNGDGAGVFRSTDGGATWTEVFDQAISGGPLRTDDGSLKWLLFDGGGLISSTDDGATWTVVPGATYAYPGSLLQLPDGRLVTLTRQNVIVSSDAGESWRVLGPPLPWEPSGVTFSPARNEFYAWHFGCEIGVDNPIPADAIATLSVTMDAASSG